MPDYYEYSDDYTNSLVNDIQQMQNIRQKVESNKCSTKEDLGLDMFYDLNKMCDNKKKENMQVGMYHDECIKKENSWRCDSVMNHHECDCQNCNRYNGKCQKCNCKN